MVSALRMTVGLALVLGVTGCATGKEADQNADQKAVTIMPDVVGRTLDVALSDIKRAGVEDEVEVLGGGTFGVVDESNWKVCEQVPAAGDEVTAAPRLTVDRSCGDDASGSTTPSTEVPSSAQPSETSTQETAPQDTEPQDTTPVPTQPAAQEVLSAENNEDLAALLLGPDECDDTVAQFAAKYAGRTIEFDGNIASMAPHGDYVTRFDFLVYAGDYSETSVTGPSFQFSDEGFIDLHLTGSNIPDSIAQGTNLHIVATVGEFTTGCLLLLEPVSTEAR